MADNTRDPRTYAIIGAAMEVHRELGRGFLEAVYQEAFEKEARRRGLPFAREVELPIFYKGERLNTEYRCDFVCFGEVVLELKVLSKLTDREEARLVNYLKASRLEVGQPINLGMESLQAPRLDEQICAVCEICG